VVFRRGQIRRIGWLIKTLEAQVGQFLLGCKCPVSRFLHSRAKDLTAPGTYRPKAAVLQQPTISHSEPPLQTPNFLQAGIMLYKEVLAVRC
jgi:hypothetical protein